VRRLSNTDPELQAALTEMVREQQTRAAENEILRKAARILAHRKYDESTNVFSDIIKWPRQKYSNTRVRVVLTARFIDEED